jgi:phage FluMu protein Com
VKQITIPLTTNITIPDSELFNPFGDYCQHMEHGEYKFRTNRCTLFNEILNKKEGDSDSLMKCKPCKAAWEDAKHPKTEHMTTYPSSEQHQEDPQHDEKFDKFIEDYDKSFSLKDFLALDDINIIEVLKETANEDLTLCLYDVSDDIKKKFLKGMSDRAAAMIEEDITILKPQRRIDVQNAQIAVITTLLRLKREHRISHNGYILENDEPLPRYPDIKIYRG